MKAAEALALLAPDEAAAIAEWEFPAVPDEVVARVAPILHAWEDRALLARTARAAEAASASRQVSQGRPAIAVGS